ncbi:hypothetical protein [Candidatus Poriferisodalis sp.]|uniref:hypothetical protein n=1 Tax=Candidatus Poriferisodalis sp. TaxID=3101277 RepID=UPI003B0124F5
MRLLYGAVSVALVASVLAASPQAVTAGPTSDGSGPSSPATSATGPFDTAATQWPGEAPAQARGSAGAGPASSAPMLSDGFVLGGTWLAPGVVGLDWDDVPGSTGYELIR